MKTSARRRIESITKGAVPIADVAVVLCERSARAGVGPRLCTAQGHSCAPLQYQACPTPMRCLCAGAVHALHSPQKAAGKARIRAFPLSRLPCIARVMQLTRAIDRSGSLVAGAQQSRTASRAHLRSNLSCTVKPHCFWKCLRTLAKRLARCTGRRQLHTGPVPAHRAPAAAESARPPDRTRQEHGDESAQSGHAHLLHSARPAVR